MKTITTSQLETILSVISGGVKTKVEFVAQTKPTMRKTGNPYLDAKKVATVTGYINCDYAKEVNNARKKAGLTTDFVSAPRVYGQKESRKGTLVYSDKHEVKLEVMHPKTKNVHYLNSNGLIPSSKIEQFLNKNTSSRQGLPSHVTVKVVNYNLSSIKQIKIGNTWYEII